MVDTIAEFHDAQAESDREICDLLAREINDALPEAARAKYGTDIPSGSFQIIPSSALLKSSEVDIL